MEIQIWVVTEGEKERNVKRLLRGLHGLEDDQTRDLHLKMLSQILVQHTKIFRPSTNEGSIHIFIATIKAGLLLESLALENVSYARH